MTRQFNDIVSMDLKQWSYQDGIWLLHLIDHATRASCVIRYKNREVVIGEIFKIWIRIFGTAGKFLMDNGGAFDKILEVCMRT